MPLAQTDRFGPLEYDAQSEISFPYGIPGFDNEHRFLLLERPEVAPFVFLQSLDTPALCFTALPAIAIDPQYDLQLTPEDTAALSDNETLFPLALLTATDHGLTANLLAPVVIHLTRRIGLQAIRADARYSHCHRLGDPVACS
jgi:flagellar assembly factor FliW